MHKLVMCVNTEEQAEHCHQNHHRAQVSKSSLCLLLEMHKTTKQLTVFLKDKNEGDDVVPKEMLFFLVS